MCPKGCVFTVFKIEIEVKYDILKIYNELRRIISFGFGNKAFAHFKIPHNALISSYQFSIIDSSRFRLNLEEIFLARCGFFATE